MRMERTKNAVRNIVYGSVLKIYQLLIPFVMRTVMIYVLGVEYLGLNSLFTSVLQVLNLAELGVGTAMVFSMYEPIAKDDSVTVCALMRLYKLYYRGIGAAVLVFGLLLQPLIPSLIHSDLPAGINLQLLYLMNLGATVLSYWFLAYKGSVFQAHQRIDITNKVSFVTETMKCILQLAALLIFQNYYLYVMAILISQALTNLAVSILADKIYPECRAGGRLPREQIRVINNRIRDLFLVKIGTVCTASADTIVISAFLGLTALAVYQNYYYLITSMIGFVTIIFNACTAGIGNSLLTETKEKNFGDLKLLTFIIGWIAGFATICYLCLAQPFVERWVGKKLMLEFPVVICLCAYFYIYEMSFVMLVYKDAAGIWHKDRFRSWVTTLVNLVLNLLLVQYWGIYGVVLATVLAKLVVGMPWLLQNVFHLIFPVEYRREYIKRLIQYALITLAGCLVTYAACSRIQYAPVLTFLLRLIVCIFVGNIFFCLCSFRFPEFTQARMLLLRIVRKKKYGE